MLGSNNEKIKWLQQIELIHTNHGILRFSVANCEMSTSNLDQYCNVYPYIIIHEFSDTQYLEKLLACFHEIYLPLRDHEHQQNCM